MCAHTFVLVVVCVARKLRPCPSYSGHRGRDNPVHRRSLYKGGGNPSFNFKYNHKETKMGGSNKERKAKSKAQQGKAPHNKCKSE